MKRYRLTFDATVRDTDDKRRVSALRVANTKAEAIEQLAADYEDIKNLIVEELP